MEVKMTVELFVLMAIFAVFAAPVAALGFSKS